MFPALVSFAAIFAASVITSTETSYIRLETNTSAVEAGKWFAVDVYANAHVPVNAVDVTIQFDSTAVQVVGVDTGQSVLTIWTEEPVAKAGKVVLRGGTFRKGFVGEHLIATINLKSTVTGQKDITATDILLLAGDGAGSPVTVAETTGSVVSLFVYDENTKADSIGVEVEVRVVTDIDGDGKVDLRDVSAFMAAWHSRSTLYDFNGDGRMTFRDFSIILADLFLK
jgi:hypothetical protein